MKKYLTLLALFASLVGVLNVFLSPSKSAAGGPKTALQRQALTRCASFVASLPEGATLRQIQTHLPAGCTMSRPHYGNSEVFFGNRVSMSGPIRGELIFLPPRYAAQHGRGAPGTPIRFGQADVLDYARMTLSDQPNRSRSYGVEIIRVLSQTFGKPSHQTYELYSPEKAGEETGWTATWRLNGGRKVTYFQDLSGDYYAVLQISFPYSINVARE